MPKSPRKTVAPKKRPESDRQAAELIQNADELTIIVDGVRVPLSQALDLKIRRAVEAAAKPLPPEMTTTQAAEFLDVSRPFVIKLIKRGQLPCRMVGSHRRIPTAALEVVQQGMFEKAREAAVEMTRIAQEMGPYEFEGPNPLVR